MRKPWPTFSTESAGFCLSPPSDSDRLLPVVPTAVRRSLLIMDAKQGFQIEYKRGSMECYFVRYSNWYSNQNTKLILTIIINRINYRFKLPRPTTSSSKDVHGRLFLCLKSSKYGGFSAIEFHYCSHRSILKCIPSGIPSARLVNFGIHEQRWSTPCAPKPPAFQT